MLTPPPMLLQALSPLSSSAATASDSSSSSDSYNPSLIIIVAILFIASLVTAAIVVVLRLLSRTPPSSPPFRRRANSAFRSSTAAALGDDRGKPTVVVDSLPLVSFASIAASKLSSSSDCAVCLSVFRSGEQLRLLPDCRHAFHTPCIDAWLRSPAASCPLCRSPINTPAAPPPPTTPPPQSPRAPVEPPGDEVATEAGGSERSWLKEYVDRLASSASSLSSFRISDRWSWRFEASGRSWDPEVGDIGGGGSLAAVGDSSPNMESSTTNQS